MKWDDRFLGMAELISSYSKDPSTKVGTVIVRPDKTVASTGFNGFPKGLSDDPMLYDIKEFKYSRIIHAEMNALLFAKEDLLDYTLYTFPCLPCDRCAMHIIQAGIKRVVTFKCTTKPQWEEAWKLARSVFKEAGVEVIEI